MENERRSSVDSRENTENVNRNKDNTEYVPTRCRITKPIPPKPAANPMQFVKITPCPLLRKAQEQIKKAEEVKTVRQGIRDDAEDWQANLDNWKSSRRKRQEHIIERVVEVKKFEQLEQEKTRRKSKTFNEILEERNKRKSKLSISIYDNDDSNDLSDYGIGLGPTSSTPYSDTSSNVQTDEEELNAESDSSKCKTPPSERPELRDEQNNWESKDEKKEEFKKWERKWSATEEENNWNKKGFNWNDEKGKEKDGKKLWEDLDLGDDTKGNFNWKEQRQETIKKESEDGFERIEKKEETEQVANWRNINEPNKQEQQYTYESAIQGYRTRVKSNLNNSNFFNNTPTEKTDEEANIIVPKGSILKRKELFENEKLYELNSYESIASRRLCEDFVHSQSLKERLLSLEKFTEQPRSADEPTRVAELKAKPRSSMLESIKSDLEKNKNSVISNWDKGETSDRSSSPETNLFVNKIEKFHCSLDNLAGDTDRDGSECGQSNYPASNSSTELLGLSSQYCDTDREDSGIHTADVSCSVSQADEPVEDSEITATPVEKYTPEIQDVPAVDPIIQTLPWNDIYTIDNVFSTEEFPLGLPKSPLEPPKEKPPPPPMSLPDEDLPEEELKRINSTKRIKNEIRLKRSSFLGINPEDQVEDEAQLDARKPPDINSFLQKERTLEKQMYKKTQGSYSEAGDSQDSGVELERGRLSTDTWCNSIPDCRTTPVHGRQDSGPCTTNSITSEEDEIIKKEREIIELVEKEEQWRGQNECEFIKPDLAKSRSAPKLDLVEPISSPYDPMTESVSSLDDEHSEILRVKHELLQLEREEMERQRENMIFRESEPRNGLKNKRLSLEDISHPVQPTMYMYQPDADYRKSMPELQHEVHMANYNPYAHPSGAMSRSMHTSPVKHNRPMMYDHYERDKYHSGNPIDHSDPCLYQHSAPMNIHSKPVPRPVARHSLQPMGASNRNRHSSHEGWLRPRQSGDMREKFNYSQHWLIQEAEQRRISEQQKFMPTASPSWKLTRPDKHLPDSVIQTLTQRVQNKVTMPDRNVLGKRMDNIPMYNPHTPHAVGHAQLHHSHLMEDPQDKMLSVSGKKKCSYCENELGRGAAMIIESLCLFYHMDCFKCCVCHVQLGDGLMGTDVRVRNNKLHCHNCYSSDDGVKFSCV